MQSMQRRPRQSRISCNECSTLLPAWSVTWVSTTMDSRPFYTMNFIGLKWLEMIMYKLGVMMGVFSIRWISTRRISIRRISVQVRIRVRVRARVRVFGELKFGELKRNRHDVPLFRPTWSSTSLPRWSSHFSLWSRFSSSSALRQPTLAHCSLLSTQHIGRRALSTSGLTVWNSLPDELIDPARSFDSFRQFFTTILFSLY